MNKDISTRTVFLSAFFILISSCAKVSTPSGGERDKTPPVVMESIPALNTKNFKGNNIKVTFDEFVVLDNINDKLLVSPPMKKKPTVSMKGKSVITEFEEPLKDNTTYTVYFQDGIKDLNEGNKLSDYQFVFSTGNYIDSLSVTGNVYNALNLEIPESVLVLMYKDFSDSTVTKHLPDYAARLNETGFFRINNVHEGKYRLYALKDADNSKTYNLEDEEFAFSDSIIEVTPERNFIPPMKDTLAIRNAPGNKPGSSKTSTKPSNNDQKAGDKSKDQSKTSVKTPEPVPEKGAYQLILFTGPKKDHYLTSSSRPKKYQLLYTLSLPPENMDFAFSIQNADEEAYFIEKSREKDTIKVWITDSTLYSQPSISSIVKYPFTDTLGINGYKQDTITMRFTPPRETRGAKVKKSVYEINTNIRGGSMKPGQQTILSSETPFRQLDTTHIRLYEVLDSTKIRVPYKLEKDSSDACRYFLNAKFLPKKKYFFIADSASINNIYNEYSDSLGINFVVKDPESYSKLILNVKNFKGNRIIQLLDTKEKLVKEVYMKADGKVEFPLLDNGFYRLRVIYDLNGDGKWTTGYFNSGQQPEPVSYFPTEIEIKTGFDIEQDWDIGTFNLKDYKLKALKKAK